ncbi:hypothetical protein MMC26_005361 [Xylographa opegraphella]|nr:hypothetical protein [Xylographa opegraphella]
MSCSRHVVGSFQRSHTLIRHASTASATVKIPPESPKFIDIPRAPQEYAYKKPHYKGVLPTPRQIFRPGKTDKWTSEYIAAVTPEPSIVKTHTSPKDKALAEWRSRQAANRRQNLRDGLRQLHQRKVRSDRRMTARSEYKQAEHERRIHEPEREDERLTNPSIIQALKHKSSNRLQDPDREARVAKMKARFEAKEAAKVEERRNALHSLYMNARDFIVTEDALNAKVDEVFDHEWFRNYPDHSIWDKEGFPDTVQSMLSESTSSKRGNAQSTSGYIELTKRRVQRIAEELTGGKM